MSCHVVNNLLVNNDGIYHQQNAREKAGRGGGDVIVVGRTHSARLSEDKDWAIDNTHWNCLITSFSWASRKRGALCFKLGKSAGEIEMNHVNNNSREKSSFGEADGSSSRQETLHILKSPKVHYHAHKDPQCPYSEPERVNRLHTTSLRSNLILSSHLSRASNSIRLLYDPI